MRALLDRYSPNGSWIVRSFDTLPREFKFGNRTITLSNSGDFASYFDDNSPARLVDHMSTAVHEVYHAITGRLGYQLQVEAGVADAVEAEGFYINRTPQLVRFTPTFPSRDMHSTYPADARSTRYEIYVSRASDMQSTQQSGVYGLLEEWTAYLHDAQTIIDFWPWLRDEAPKTRAVYVRYRSRFHEIWMPHMEFKLFILHYLQHARDHRPDVYRALLDNDSFRRAFAATDNAWTELLAKASALEPTIVALAGERGAATTIFHRDEAFPAVQRALTTDSYQRILAELRR